MPKLTYEYSIEDDWACITDVKVELSYSDEPNLKNLVDIGRMLNIISKDEDLVVRSAEDES